MITTMEKLQKLVIFGLFTFILGFFAGAAVWAVLKIMHLGIEFIWHGFPALLHIEAGLGYHLAICLFGGLLIGLIQQRVGVLPDNMHQVMGKVKSTGGYPYDHLGLIAVTALLPLIFGGALGPEAGLSGFIAGLCCFIGDRLKYKGDMVAAMAETGISATLTAVFKAPFFGVASQLERDAKDNTYRKKLVAKKTRILLYCMGVIGAMAAMKLMGRFFGANPGLPRFTREHAIGWGQWKWALLLFVVGIVTAIVFLFFNKITIALNNRFGNHRIAACLIVGVVLAVVGFCVPEAMFSGEEQMGDLIHEWIAYPSGMLILIGITKMFLTNFCINLGWRGGNIFPLIYSGVAIGYAFSIIVQMQGVNAMLDGRFAVALVVASMYGYIMQKPLMVVAVLLLCFPITYIIPIAVAAFVAAKIPQIPALKGGI